MMFYRMLLFLLIIFPLSLPSAQAGNSLDRDERCRELTKIVKQHWKPHPGFDWPVWFLIVFDKNGQISQVEFDETRSPILEVGKSRAATVENLTNYVLEEYRGVRTANGDAGEVPSAVRKAGESFLFALALKSEHFAAAGNLPSKKNVSMHVALCNKTENISAYSDGLNLLPWLEEASKKTHKVWFPPSCVLKARVTFRVNKDGSVSEVKVTPPVDSYRDLAALKAVGSASPYKPLPAGAPKFIVVKLVLGWVWPLGWRGGKYRSF